MKVQPYLVGSGNAGTAIVKCLAILPLIDPALEILPPIRVARGAALPRVDAGGSARPVLFLANPHGLHAKYLVDGEASGFRLMIVDKPACVSLLEIPRLEGLEATVAVCHGYRLMWGPQTLKAMLEAEELGDVVCLEGRYWQSSAAQRATAPPSTAKPSWKNDLQLNGPHDVLVDLGAHWVDLAFYLLGESARKTSAWLAYPSAEAPHRDTHVHLVQSFSGGRRALASLSKAFHGKGNLLELHVLGTRQAASWSFESPDELVLARGRETRILRRSEAGLGSRQPPFHGMGWLEGYLEVLYRALSGKRDFPSLAEHLPVMRALLSANTPD